VANLLTVFVPETQTTLGNTLRLRAGGDLPAVPSNPDPLTQALLFVARETWTQMLTPRAIMPGFALPHFGVRSGIGETHPLRRSTIHLALNDPELHRMFPHSIESTDPLTGETYVSDAVGDWISSTGAAGTQYLSMVLWNLVAMSGFRALSLAGELSFPKLCEQLPVAVNDLRGLAAGREVNIPLVSGVTGLSISPDLIFQVGEGEVRQLTELEKSWYFLDLAEVRSALFTEVPTRWIPLPRPDAGDDPEAYFSTLEVMSRKLQKYRQVTNDRITNVQLAVLLSEDLDSTLTFAEQGRLYLEPSGQGPWTLMQWWPRPVAPRHQRGETVNISSPETDFADWWLLLEQNETDVLRLAFDRSIRAATERDRPSDRLVDCMIALESLVGGESEMTFRVSLAIAWALEPESETARRDLQERMKSIYHRRSRLVHGSRTDDESLEALAEEAFIVLVRLIRVLLRDRPELLSLRNGTERSLALCLRGEGGTVNESFATNVPYD